LAFFSKQQLICITIITHFGLEFGTAMVLTNALTLALVDYKMSIGTASSLLGFLYWCVTSFFMADGRIAQ